MLERLSRIRTICEVSQSIANIILELLGCGSGERDDDRRTKARGTIASGQHHLPLCTENLQNVQHYVDIL